MTMIGESIWSRHRARPSLEIGDNPDWARQKTKAQPRRRLGFWGKALAMTYFLTGNPQYHRRDVVSRSCSGWEGVGPTRYGRQEFCVVLAWVFEAHALTRLFGGCRRFGLMRDCVVFATSVVLTEL